MPHRLEHHKTTLQAFAARSPSSKPCPLNLWRFPAHGRLLRPPLRLGVMGMEGFHNTVKPRQHPMQHWLSQLLTVSDKHVSCTGPKIPLDTQGRLQVSAIQVAPHDPVRLVVRFGEVPSLLRKHKQPKSAEVKTTSTGPSRVCSALLAFKRQLLPHVIYRQGVPG